jgi:hypothetical protein
LVYLKEIVFLLFTAFVEIFLQISFC